ncbi:L,D-transpeptidase catalytic domain [Cohaesibacter marisflavi]|uniref:L,D-transpeptidase catalytic domain n=1 Tax=Cohaesibacter marisflavi TaxID=655353 RepID=A0A1I5FZT5_9HYPH|nr:L,D-transpeptidase [Cohaesibacter marisflavi]SFO29119.1 L,D-transpeptidase catalytic domain [Cohaesibacter marisflavi]
MLALGHSLISYLKTKIFTPLSKTAALGLMLTALLGATPSFATVNDEIQIRVDLAKQKMFVSINGWKKYTWPISSAREGFDTPEGLYRPTRMYETYRSKEYNNAPMPYSIFFYRGYAIHGTSAVKSLGTPASHGCIRLDPDNAKQLYELVDVNGKNNTRVFIH